MTGGRIGKCQVVSTCQRAMHTAPLWLLTSPASRSLLNFAWSRKAIVAQGRHKEARVEYWWLRGYVLTWEGLCISFPFQLIKARQRQKLKARVLKLYVAQLHTHTTTLRISLNPKTLLINISLNIRRVVPAKQTYYRSYSHAYEASQRAECWTLYHCRWFCHTIANV
jgi:hypothetical protein